MELLLMAKFVDWKDVPIILSTKEVANILGVHVNTVKSLISKGDLPAFKVGRVLKINKSDLMRYVGLKEEANTQDQR